MQLPMGKRNRIEVVDVTFALAVFVGDAAFSEQWLKNHRKVHSKRFVTNGLNRDSTTRQGPPNRKRSAALVLLYAMTLSRSKPILHRWVFH